MIRPLRLALVLGLAAFLSIHASPASASPSNRLLFIYDEENKNNSPYLALFRADLQSAGLAFDESPAAGLKGKDLSAYDRILVYGIVQAFAMKEPLRDWLGTGPDLGGKTVSLFVTANRWFAAKLFSQLQDLLRKDGAQIVDAVSMATKDMADSDKREAVRRLVAGMAH